MIAEILSVFFIAYFLGSIPFGLLLVRAAGLGDVRAIGSGNIGATNVMRTGNKMLGVATLLLDASKGVLAVVLCKTYYSQDMAALAALFAVLGHVFPVWLRFKGGKGVATSLGVFLALNWHIAACVAALWMVMFLITRISSISALVSIGYSSIAAYVFDNYMTALLCLAISALMIFTHQTNLIRLMTGKEMSFKKAR